jgi:hypothetical protein
LDRTDVDNESDHDQIRGVEVLVEGGKVRDLRQSIGDDELKRDEHEPRPEEEEWEEGWSEQVGTYVKRMERRSAVFAEGTKKIEKEEKTMVYEIVKTLWMYHSALRVALKVQVIAA